MAAGYRKFNTTVQIRPPVWRNLIVTGQHTGTDWRMRPNSSLLPDLPLLPDAGQNARRESN